MKISRRSFMLVTAGLASSLILERNAAAQAGPVLESDANAQALGYKTDASKVDKAKYPKPSTWTSLCELPVFPGIRPAMQWLLARSLAASRFNAKGWCRRVRQKSENRSN